MGRCSKPAAPWTYLGDLDLEDANYLRHVARTILEQLDETTFLQPSKRAEALKPCSFTNIQKHRIIKILNELEDGGDLLREATIWFCRQWIASDAIVIHAASELNNSATRYVTLPKQYTVEHAIRRQAWNAFIEATGDSFKAGDSISAYEPPPARATTNENAERGQQIPTTDREDSDSPDVPDLTETSTVDHNEDGFDTITNDSVDTSQPQHVAVVCAESPAKTTVRKPSHSAVSLSPTRNDTPIDDEEDGNSLFIPETQHQIALKQSPTLPPSTTDSSLRHDPRSKIIQYHKDSLYYSVTTPQTGSTDIVQRWLHGAQRASQGGRVGGAVMESAFAVGNGSKSTPTTSPRAQVNLFGTSSSGHKVHKDTAGTTFSQPHGKSVYGQPVGLTTTMGDVGDSSSALSKIDNSSSSLSLQIDSCSIDDAESIMSRRRKPTPSNVEENNTQIPNRSKSSTPVKHNVRETELEGREIVTSAVHDTEQSITTPLKRRRRTKMVNYQEIPPEPMSNDELTAVNHGKMYYRSSQSKRKAKSEVVLKAEVRDDFKNHEGDQGVDMLHVGTKTDAGNIDSERTGMDFELAKSSVNHTPKTKKAKRKRVPSPESDSGDSWNIFDEEIIPTTSRTRSGKVSGYMRKDGW